jgi:hypothetical protein
MRVCWKHFVDEDFVPLVCWFDGLDALFTCFCLIVSRLGMPHSNKSMFNPKTASPAT